MVRVLNFICFALAATCCLALYHVSEQTRVAHDRYARVETDIATQREALKVLEADWERVSEPSKIQTLAQTRLGFADSATVALASLDYLPRRGQATPFAPPPVQAASAVAAPVDAPLRLVSDHAGD
ncbi:MAG TPA: hypothetical protein VGF97_06065 [Rhizomicrobium sp.]|jgi:hypothetical protein